MRALLIDDSRAMRSLEKGALREVGIAEVVEACDGREGLATLDEKGPFDLVVVDWLMPEMDGCEFVRQVRARPAFAGLKVLMVTSISERKQIARALEAGATDYVMKPFTRDALVARLKMLVGG